jgi:transcriptional regulator with GAF, ATPase, and Fis domain
MPDFETIQPPPPPRPSQVHTAVLGLWVQCTPDAARHGAVVPLDHAFSVSVGRGRDVTFNVEDSWQSRAHFRVSVQPGTTELSGIRGPWLLEDLGTRNGTFVNGVRVEQAVLRLGDVIRSGATVFVLDRGVDAAGDDLGLIGRSAELDRIRAQIRLLAPGSRPVHLTGESGVGKEVVAQALHARSGRGGRMLGLNMATIVSNLAESQLFGHRRGSFSGTVGDQQGAFDVAHRGTLLLDEIADLDLALQAKLLRAVEAGEIHRVGDALPHKVDVRLITATHCDLAEMAVAGTFRPDLYWRIAHGSIEVPPLRERPLDIAPLVDHFLAAAGSPPLHGLVRLQPRAAWQAADLLERYLQHDWTGNVRELREEVLRLADTMRLRAHRQVSGPIPPLDEACSERLTLLAHRPRKDTAKSAPTVVTNPQEIARFESLLVDVGALGRAIQTEAQGNVKLFADRASAVLGRNPGTMRRQIYRLLGEQLATLRQS